MTRLKEIDTMTTRNRSTDTSKTTMFAAKRPMSMAIVPKPTEAPNQLEMEEFRKWQEFKAMQAASLATVPAEATAVLVETRGSVDVGPAAVSKQPKQLRKNVYPYEYLMTECKEGENPRSAPVFDVAHEKEYAKAHKRWIELQKIYQTRTESLTATEVESNYIDALDRANLQRADVAHAEKALKSAGKTGLTMRGILESAFGMSTDVIGEREVPTRGGTEMVRKPMTEWDAYQTWRGKGKDKEANERFERFYDAQSAIVSAIHSGTFLQGAKRYGTSETYYARGL